MNTPLKLLVTVLILSVGLVIGSFLLIYRPTDSTAINPVSGNPDGNNSGEENTGMPIMDALPVFYSNSVVNSMEEAAAVLKQNFGAIEADISAELLQYGKTNDANIIRDMILFNEHVTVERRAWRNDQYWLYPNRTVYVLVIPAVSKLENWVENESKIIVERVNLTEGTVQGAIIPVNATSFEDLKNNLNEKYPGRTETFWTETRLWIKYLVDDNGTVYWAGQYLLSMPWLE